jgi:uncharacterized protein (TIGR02996 family)
MSDRSARLLAEVIADPDSDSARQVYADELLTRGDPRGELVQIDAALAGGLSIRKRAVLNARRAELVGQHGSTWWPFPLECRVRYGFVEAVTGTLAQLVAAGPALFAAEPVVEVTVTELGGKAGARKLAGAPWLPRVRGLAVRGLDDAGFAVLAAAGGCQGLASLNVSASRLSASAPAALGNHLPACRTLVLTGNDIGDDGIAGLRAWTHVTDVETLYLAECDLSTRGVAMLIAAPLPALVKLGLTGNELDDGVASVFAASAPNLPALRVLELKAAGLSRAVLDTFQHANLALDRLDLRRNSIRPADAAALPFVRAGWQ